MIFLYALKTYVYIPLCELKNHFQEAGGKVSWKYRLQKMLHN